MLKPTKPIQPAEPQEPNPNAYYTFQRILLHQAPKSYDTITECIEDIQHFLESKIGNTPVRINFAGSDCMRIDVYMKHISLQQEERLHKAREAYKKQTKTYSKTLQQYEQELKEYNRQILQYEIYLTKQKLVQLQDQLDEEAY